MVCCWAGPLKFDRMHRIMNFSGRRAGPWAKIAARARSSSQVKNIGSCPAHAFFGLGRVFFGRVGSGSSGRAAYDQVYLLHILKSK